MTMKMRNDCRVFKPSKKTLILSVALTAIHFGLMDSAFADCTGSLAAGFVCNNTNDDGAAANVNVTNTSTYVSTGGVGGAAVSGGTTLLQFNGHGRTLTVDQDAALQNFRNINGSRTAVYMGAPTTNASATTKYLSVTTGTSINLLGANGTTIIASIPTGTVINKPDGTPTTLSFSGGTGTLLKLDAGLAFGDSIVGQSLALGRWATSDGGDFIPGTSYKILAYDTTNRIVLVEGLVSASSLGSGSPSLDPVYAVVSNFGKTTDKVYATSSALGTLFSKGERYNEVTTSGKNSTIKFNNVISNSGEISSRILNAELPAANAITGSYVGTLKGITTSVFGDYLIENNARGLINVTHAGIGSAYGIEAGGTVTSLSINNVGTISAVRDLALSSSNFTSITATGSPSATAGSHPTAAVGNVNAINTQEELQTLNLYNSGTISTTGDYTGTILSRASVKNIINDRSEAAVY